MISALSGAGSRALLTLFGRPKSQGPADDVSQVAARASASNTLPEATRGVPPESLFAALVDQTGVPDTLASQAISALDRNGNGSLSSAELMQAYQAVASTGTFASVAGLVSNIFGAVDGDGDGAVTAGELSSAMAGLTGQGNGSPLIDQVMAQLDADGSGVLSRDEVAQALGLGGSLADAPSGIAGRPETAPKSMYEAMFAMRLDPSRGESSADAREAITARLQDRLSSTSQG